LDANIDFLPDGTVTSPAGFSAGATYSGMKSYTEDKRDLGVLLSETPCVTAGVFTTNLIKSPSVIVSQQLMQGGKVRAVVVNSGVANTSVGEQGFTDAQETMLLAAEHTGIGPEEICMCSTGLIGGELPMALIRSGLPNIGLSPEGGDEFARAILTTDRRPKSAAVRLQIEGNTVTIGGCIKGSGMIHPNMATMLAFITTDAAVEKDYLSALFKEVASETFNMTSIDGDESTNDTALMFASGRSGNRPLLATSPEALRFRTALMELCVFLSKEMLRDAEGASKIFAAQIEGAKTKEDARKIARAVASSMLVKSAVHGNDPNWGRIIAAAGRGGGYLEESKVSLYINGVTIMEKGQPIPFHRESVIVLMQNPEVLFTLQLHLGDATATAWGCELTEEYVTFNSAYTT